MLHSDITTASVNGDVPSKPASRRPSMAAGTKASNRGEAGSPSPGLTNMPHEEGGAVAVAKEKRKGANGLTEECQGHAGHHVILKAPHQTDALDENRLPFPNGERSQITRRRATTNACFGRQLKTTA
ncbi:hypothetical protein V5799_025403 [Amblyomma americanum]|uniref:Uncharacterized protein n=1 Tax=Amblyomma americanum TaxID=6943 RepID=A0AAQ4E9N6_AMBAM